MLRPYPLRLATPCFVSRPTGLSVPGQNTNHALLMVSVQNSILLSNVPSRVNDYLVLTIDNSSWY